MTAACVAANAQASSKCNDVFVGVGAGIASPLTPGFNTPAFYANLQVGKYITPVWGVRGVIGGPFLSLDANDGNATLADGSVKAFKNKTFGELNVDGMFSITNLFAKDLSKFNVYLFAGPTMNFSSVGSEFVNPDDQAADVFLVQESDDLKVRLGATAGLGLAYDITKAFALGVEARFGITPSIFGDADAYRKAAGTTRIALNGVWTIGGKRGKVARAAAAAAEAGYISKEAAEALAAEAVAKNPKIVEKIVEKEVVKQVEKLVNNEVPSSTAIFFEIGKANLTSKDKARVKLYAEAINNTKDNSVYVVNGYADKKTGSVRTNQRLSEKRAETVYKALVEAGVDPSRLEKQAFGGVDALFFNNDVLSRTVIIKKKSAARIQSIWKGSGVRPQGLSFVFGYGL